MRDAVVGCGLGLALAVAPGAPCQTALPPQSISIAGVATLGNPDAPLVVIEFSDFHCPFCRQHARQTLPSIKRDFIDQGKLLYAFRHFPLDRTHPSAQQAAVAAECALRQGRFWELHERFFAAPRPVGPAQLERTAKAAGLDLSRFKPCLTGIAVERVRDDVQDARRLGLRATPSFLFGTNDGKGNVRLLRRVGGAHPYAVFKELLERLSDPS